MSEVVRQDYSRGTAVDTIFARATVADQSGKIRSFRSRPSLPPPPNFSRRVDRWTTAVVNFSTITAR